MTSYLSEVKRYSIDRAIIEIPEKGEFMNYAAPIEIGDAVLEAWEPANQDSRRLLILRVHREGAFHDYESPMFHPNIFGVDVEDAGNFNEMTERVIKELGLE